MEVRVAERRFYFWESYGKAFDMLTDEEAGAFVKACYRFAFEDVEPDFTDVPKLAFAWQIVSGQIARSVEIGVLNAERGKQGGRPRKSGAKTTAKTTAKSGAKSGVKSTAESGVESGAESVRYGNVPIATGAPLESRPCDVEEDPIDFDNLPPME